MEAGGRPRRNNNTSLREIQQEDEEDRQHRSSQLRRSKLPSVLPSIYRPEIQNDLVTKKSEPFSWYRSNGDEYPLHDTAEMPSAYYQPDSAQQVSASSSRKGYYKSSSANRVHTQLHRVHQDPTHETHKQLPSRILDPAKSSKVNYADKLEREVFGEPVRILKQRPDRHQRQSNSSKNRKQYYKLVPRVHTKRKPNTITEDDDEETSSVKSREYMTDQPLTFGIFAPDEDPQASNIDNTVPYEEIMHRLYLSIPASTEHRREESVRELCYRLYKTNPLFLKLEYLTCVEMICTCKVYSMDRGRSLFESNEELVASYIVLWGSVEIFTEEGVLQGFYQAGSTLCEEYLLIGNPKKIGERARAGKRGCGVLELTHNGLKTMRQNLTRIQLKKDLVMLQSVFRKNYFSKKSIRNSFKYRTGGDT